MSTYLTPLALSIETKMGGYVDYMAEDILEVLSNFSQYFYVYCHFNDYVFDIHNMAEGNNDYDLNFLKCLHICHVVYVGKEYFDITYFYIISSFCRYFIS